MAGKELLRDDLSLPLRQRPHARNPLQLRLRGQILLLEHGVLDQELVPLPSAAAAAAAATAARTVILAALLQPGVQQRVHLRRRHNKLHRQAGPGLNDPHCGADQVPFLPRRLHLERHVIATRHVLEHKHTHARLTSREGKINLLCWRGHQDEAVLQLLVGPRLGLPAVGDSLRR